MKTVLPRLAVAALSGVLWALAFSTYGAAWMSWFALLPLFLVLRKGGFGAGWAFGVGFWTVSIHWIAPTLVTAGGFPTSVGWLGLFFLSMYLALFQGVFGWIGYRMLAPEVTSALGPWAPSGAVTRSLRSRLLGQCFLGPWVWLAVPAAWVVIEILQGKFFPGFPWNPAAQAWVDLPGVLPLASWLGTPGISWLVILIPTAAVVSVRRRNVAPLLVSISLVAVLLAAADRWANPGPSAGSIAIALVQPNETLLTDWDRGEIEKQYRETLELIDAACFPGTLVVIPESAAFPYSYSMHQRLRDDIDGLTDSGCSLVINATRSVDERTYNSALLVGEGGVIGSYDKVHLVPWGEYIPFRTLLPFVKQIARGASEFTPGAEADAIEWRSTELGVSICYDAIYSNQTRDLVDSGAELLVHLTNDAWYGDTSAPRQLLRASRFRAAESGRSVVRAALTGISAIIDPSGQILETIALGSAGTVTARVAIHDHQTFYQRWPWLVPLFAAACLGFVMVVPGWRSPRGVLSAGE